MADSAILASVLQRAVDAYLRLAYPTGVPAAIESRLTGLRSLPDNAPVPEDMLDRIGPAGGWSLRLGQPKYPHMKLVVEAAPGDGAGLLFRADAHDMHLHAPAGSPDAAWLAEVRASNKALVEAIEAAWTQIGIPTFREFLRAQVAKRRAAP